ncbi:MAG TPA: AMP-binding protein [Actinomycetes bacterium]|nr:AMP-binding protein [Actinomycetes bacterium]
MVGNVAELLRQTAREHGDRRALVVPALGRELTWAEFDGTVDAMVVGLRARLSPGARVALVFGNSVEFVTAYFAVLRAGLVAVPVNNGYTEPEIRRVLADSRAELVLAEATAAGTARAAAQALDAGGPDVVEVGSDEWRDLGHAATGGQPESAGSAADAEPEPAGSAAHAGPEALAVLAYTSGTSGEPKGAMLSHRALLASIESTLALDPAPVEPDDVVLLTLPMFHLYALNGVLGPLVATGATGVLAERFDPAPALALIEQHRITMVPGAPAMYAAWATRPDLRHALATARLLISGSAPLPSSVLEQVHTSTGLTVYEGYGLTETAPAATSTLASARVKPGSIGRPVPGVEVRLVDETGEPVAEGDPGEIQVRGANLFSGYWPNGSGGPGPDGWWSTGDVAYTDEDGDLFIVDRRKELVLVSGFNVYPREVEDALLTHPDVVEAAVVAVPHPITGEAVKAFVVARPGAELTTEQVIAHCAPRLARFKRPTIVAIVPELPHSTIGKVAKGRLRADEPGDETGEETA